MDATLTFRSLAASFRTLVTDVWPVERINRALPASMSGAPEREGADTIDGLSVDLEDYYQVEAFASQIARSQWPTFPSRIRKNTTRTLALLERTGCRATFFVLG